MRLQLSHGSFVEFRLRPGPGLVKALLLACGLFAIGTSLGAAPAGAQTAPAFALPADSSVPVLVMRQRPTELGVDAVQEIRIFGDGRCRLHRPSMMRGAGDHAWTIPPSEVRSLVRQALEAGLADLDAKAHRSKLRRERDAADAAAGIQHFRFDDDIVEFEVAVDAYRASGRAAKRNIRRSVEWRGLRADRARSPGDVSVQRLGELRDRLDGMGRARVPLGAKP